MSRPLTPENLFDMTEEVETPSESLGSLRVTADKRYQYFQVLGFGQFAQPLGKKDLPECSKNFPNRRLYNKYLADGVIKVPRGQSMNFLITSMFTPCIAEQLYQALDPESYPCIVKTIADAWMVSYKVKFEELCMIAYFEDRTVEFSCVPQGLFRYIEFFPCKNSQVAKTAWFGLKF